MALQHVHDPGEAAAQEKRPPSLALRDVTLEGAHFDDVALLACRFHNVDLSAVDIDDAAMMGATLHNVDLSRSRIHDVSLQDAVLDDVDLSGVCITDADIDGMTIDGIEVAPLVREALAARGSAPPAVPASSLPEEVAVSPPRMRARRATLGKKQAIGAEREDQQPLA